MSDLSPSAPGPGDGVGSSPYPLSGMDVTPQAPQGAEDHVAEWGTGLGGWHTEPEPKVDRHDGHMDDHRGQPKPGPFSGPYVKQDGGMP